MAHGETDFDAVLRANLVRVFSERDAAKRVSAVADLYVAEPVMYEPANILKGRQAIVDVAGKLLEQFGPTFRFVPEGVAVGHHGLACLRWHAGPKDGATLVTGIDAAEFTDGRIATLWVLLDPPTA